MCSAFTSHFTPLLFLWSVYPIPIVKVVKDSRIHCPSSGVKDTRDSPWTSYWPLTLITLTELLRVSLECGLPHRRVGSGLRSFSNPNRKSPRPSLPPRLSHHLPTHGPRTGTTPVRPRSVVPLLDIMVSLVPCVFYRSPGRASPRGNDRWRNSCVAKGNVGLRWISPFFLFTLNFCLFLRKIPKTWI